MKNECSAMRNKFAGLSTPSSGTKIWIEVECAQQNIYPSICPVSGIQDFHCLWPLLSSPRAHKFRNQRVAELTLSFIRGAAEGLER